MSLFKIDGWNIEGKAAFSGSSKRNDKKAEKKKALEKQLQAEKKVIPEDKAEVEKDGGEDTNIEEETEKMTKKSKTINKEDKGTSKVAPKRKREEEEEGKRETKEEKMPAPQPTTNLTPLQKKMMAKLSGSRFRWINEKLYTTTSENALKLIQDQPELFDEYHSGFRSQVQSWPENPVNVFVEQIKLRSKKPVNAPGGLPGLANKKVVIADMGCGEAQLALDISKNFNRKDGGNKKVKRQDRNAGPGSKLNVQVHSFDLKKANERITVADIRNVPLPDQSCTIVIFCLALMGTNFLDFIKEAYRLLSPRGELWIAEIKSRFSDGKGDEFVEALKLHGFFHKTTDDNNKMFTRFEFFKPPLDIINERKAKLERKNKFIEAETEKEQLEKKREKQPEGEWLLKPCIYKRR